MSEGSADILVREAHYVAVEHALTRLTPLG
jgi:hypothetical protein